MLHYMVVMLKPVAHCYIVLDMLSGYGTRCHLNCEMKARS